MELWDLYKQDRTPMGQTVARGDRIPKGAFRLIVHICLFNKEGNMLIQHRQPFKKGWSGYWDVSVGGSVVAGETSAMGAERELCEEIGIQCSFQDRLPVMTAVFEGAFDDFYIIHQDVEPSTLSLQYEEVSEVKYASMEEIFSMMDEGTFIPYHKSLIEYLFAQSRRVGIHADRDENPELEQTKESYSEEG